MSVVTLQTIGFTKGRSTINASFHTSYTLLKNIYEVLEESQDALVVVCALSKAFDCIHYNTLFRKPHHYGIRNKAFGILVSHLNGKI